MRVFFWKSENKKPPLYSEFTKGVKSMDFQLELNKMVEHTVSRTKTIPRDVYIESTSIIRAIPVNVKKNPGIAFGRTYRVDGGSAPHIVTVAYAPVAHEFWVWCGDAYMSGKYKSDFDAKLVEKSLAKKYPDADIEDIIAESVKSHAAYSDCDNVCNFYKNQNSCKHTYHVLHQLEVSDLEDIYNYAMEQLEEKVEVKTSTKSGVKSELAKFADRYAFKKHILVEGPKGSGKTYPMQKMIAEGGFHEVSFGGNEGTESIDLLGHLVKMPDGSYTWKDGSLSSAFRRAQTEKTVLMIDEINRIPSRELSILIGSLSPDFEGNYRLSTSRVTGLDEYGVAQEECLKVPKDNLWVVGTMNVGSDYQVDDLDPALVDRFRTFQKNSIKREVEEIIANAVSVKGFNSDLVKKFTSFMVKMKKAYESGLVASEASLRHISECIDFSETEKDIKTELSYLIPTWAGRDMVGVVDSDHEKIINSLIREHF